MRSRKFEVAFALGLLILQCGLPAPAKKTKPANDSGGYYESLQHPDMGGDPEENKQGDGYYGSITTPSAFQKKPDDPQPAKDSDLPPGTLQNEARNHQAPEPIEDPRGNTAEAASDDTARGGIDQTAKKQVVPLQPVSQSTNPLTEIEKKLFDRSYDGDTDISRLERIENAMYGTKKNGTVQERVADVIKSFKDPNEKLPKLPATAAAPIKTTAESAIKEGIEFYKQTAFHSAEESFEKATVLNPGSTEAHYWLGLSRMKLRDFEGAQKEFEVCFQLDPFGPMGQKSKQAMMEASAAAASAAHKPTDPAWLMNQTVNKIGSQTQSGMIQRMVDGQRNAAWQLRLGAMTADRINREAGGYWGYGAPANIPYGGNLLAAPGPAPAAMYGAPTNTAYGVPGYAANAGYAGAPGYGGAAGYGGYPGYGGAAGGYPGYPGYDGAAAFNGYNGGYQQYFNRRGRGYEMSDPSQIRTNYARSDAQAQSYRAQTDGMQRAKGLQDSANGLYTLLAEPPKTGEPHLRALGTNLYVRYYGNEDVNGPNLPPVDPPLLAVARHYNDKKKAANAAANAGVAHSSPPAAAPANSVPTTPNAPSGTK